MHLTVKLIRILHGVLIRIWEEYLLILIQKLEAELLLQQPHGDSGIGIRQTTGILQDYRYWQNLKTLQDKLKLHKKFVMQVS
ncbi:hypothetical protein D3C86_1880210 [compost metagenome]